MGSDPPRSAQSRRTTPTLIRSSLIPTDRPQHRTNVSAKPWTRRYLTRCLVRFRDQSQHEILANLSGSFLLGAIIVAIRYQECTPEIFKLLISALEALRRRLEPDQHLHHLTMPCPASTMNSRMAPRARSMNWLNQDHNPVWQRDEGGCHGEDCFHAAVRPHRIGP